MFTTISSDDKEMLKSLDDMQVSPPEIDQGALQAMHTNFLKKLEIRELKRLPRVGLKSDGARRPSPEQEALSQKFITALVNIITQSSDIKTSIRAVSQLHQNLQQDKDLQQRFKPSLHLLLKALKMK